VNYADLPSSSMPTAIVLPCNLFVADLRAGALTDFDLRHSVVGSALDSEGSASADPSGVAPISSARCHEAWNCTCVGVGECLSARA
jgi:hypothetical protein